MEGDKKIFAFVRVTLNVKINYLLNCTFINFTFLYEKMFKTITKVEIKKPIKNNKKTLFDA